MPQATLAPLGSARFLGVNLRQNRLALADEECAKAINADFHTQFGAIVLRLGKGVLYSSILADLVVRRLGRIPPKRWQVAGTSVYRDGVSVLSSLSSNLITSLIPYRPLNDTANQMFVADDAVMRRDDGTTVYQW